MTFQPAKTKRESGNGVKCPDCGGDMANVVDSRPAIFLDLGTIRRRRMCAVCGARATTYEMTEDQIKTMKTNIAKAMVESLMKDFWT